MKIETGRVPVPGELEDFFAATLVVPNLLALSQAEDLVCQQFELRSRRPKNRDITHKTPDSFPFDDLRLYVAVRSDTRYPETGIEGITFEVQIKTFLQHAWSIATHDLIYKSEGVEWPTDRIAYQVKAMLEHAEVSIAEAVPLAKNSVLSKTTLDILRIKKFATIIRQFWGDAAPKDMRRLALNIAELCKLIELPPKKLEQHLREYVKQRGGEPPSNLSPYLGIIECLLIHETERMRAFLAQPPDRENPRRVLVTSEIDLPAGLDLDTLPRAILVKDLGI
ncbi:hypothetical protein GR328_06910 [Microvirga makkahensis]|uniref:RelA/SpoT domain-containing protein n=1 Tax=Microvirga makkahensis TaxID=1128670 RepID=A0A7X3MQL1_9HYPH|nr:hypothetical protein [Microvirga makkahensis]